MPVVICSNIIEKEGKFVIVKETKEVVRGKYNQPGGKLDDGENLILAAKREAKEECGLDVEPEKLIGVYQTLLDDGRTVVKFVFNSKIIGGEIKTSEEHPEVDFFSIEEIREINKKGLFRSSSVIDSIEDYLNGKGFDLDLIGELKKI